MRQLRIAVEKEYKLCMEFFFLYNQVGLSGWSLQSRVSVSVSVCVCEREGQCQVFVMNPNKSCLPPEPAIVWHG